MFWEGFVGEVKLQIQFKKHMISRLLQLAFFISTYIPLYIVLHKSWVLLNVYASVV